MLNARKSNIINSYNTIGIPLKRVLNCAMSIWQVIWYRQDMGVHIKITKLINLKLICIPVFLI